MSTTWTPITKASGTSWNSVPKATDTGTTTSGGQPIGLLLALTSPGVFTSQWTPITKASGNVWTSIAKAT